MRVLPVSSVAGMRPPSGTRDNRTLDNRTLDTETFETGPSIPDYAGLSYHSQLLRSIASKRRLPSSSAPHSCRHLIALFPSLPCDGFHHLRLDRDMS